MLFYTGRQRSASSVLSEQRDAIRNGAAVEALQQMRDLAYTLRERLSDGDAAYLGEALAANWQLKRSLVGGISDGQIDEWYERARSAGASGGKLLGAGAGGFLLFFAPPERHASVRAALHDLREVPMRFTATGTRITLFESVSSDA
jgi:D-glycero-alpha-D-manno-heptose-7-phosphate kinase